MSIGAGQYEKGDPIIDGITFEPIRHMLWPENEESEFWDISEISINGPEEVFVEWRQGGYSKKPINIPELTEQWIWDTCSQLGRYHGIPFSENMPVIACKLSGGHRFHGVAGRVNAISGGIISIRIKRTFEATFEHFGVTEDQANILVAAVKAGKKIIISGGTSTGKTTFMNLLLKYLERTLRVISIQDVPELEIENRNYVGLLGSRTESGNRVTMSDLIDSLVRLNPQVSVLSEISIYTAFPALQVLISGHDSFMTTIHADDPLSVLSGFRMRAAIEGHNVSGVVPILVANVDLIVQLAADNHGKRLVTEIVSPKDLDWESITEEKQINVGMLDPIDRTMLAASRTT